eukprot:XP_011670779.1 PREDICTED: uncharacterized protein LOC105441403 isoform X2 [Strongylocentrotus purpuratus]
MTSTSNPAPATTCIYGIPEGQKGARSPYLARIKGTAIIQLIGGCLLVALGIVAIILMAVWSYFATAIWSGILIFGAILAGNNGNKFLGTAIIQLIGGCFLVTMGAVAIVIWAFWSYFGAAIWSGILVFGVIGVVGMSAASTGNKCLIRTYLGLSIVGCLAGLTLCAMHIFAAISEDSNSDDYWGCQPGKIFSWIFNCAKSQAARQVVDVLIATIALVLSISCIVSASFGCAASCKGCASCCKRCGCEEEGCCQGCALPPEPAKHQGTSWNKEVHQQARIQQGHSPTMAAAPLSTNQEAASYIVTSAVDQAPPPSEPVLGQAQLSPVEQPHDVKN